MNHVGKRRGRRYLAAAAASGLLLPMAGITPAMAEVPENFTPGVHVSPTLEGCRGSVASGSYNPLKPEDPSDTNPFVCDDDEYTTGNLGKGWNELDLVPHRLTTSLGKQASATESYDVILAADNTLGSYDGYDVITTPVVNTRLSHGSCTVIANAQDEEPGVTGGVDDAVYRVASITQDKGSTCVFDFDIRLSNSAADFSGSSLQSYLFQEGDFKTGKRTVPIPVGEVEPQSLSKSATAVQGQRYGWTVSKTVTPSSVGIPDTCAVTESSQEVEITVNWTKTGPAPAGKIAYRVEVSATNPSKRDIQVTVNDWVYAGIDDTGTLLADPNGTGGALVTPELEALVPPGTHLVGEFELELDSGPTEIFNKAVGEYFDPVLLQDVKPDKTAEFTATVEAGEGENAGATVTDFEEIGEGFEFDVVSIDGTAENDSGWVTSYNWSQTVDASGSVTFVKVVRATQTGFSGSTQLTDTAKIQGVDDAVEQTATGSTTIIADKKAEITISKSTRDVFEGEEYATFTFDLYYADEFGEPTGDSLATQDLTVDADDPVVGGFVESEVVFGNLSGGEYVVVETVPEGWSPQEPQYFDLTGLICDASATLTNDTEPASASVQKTTVPAGYEVGWTFDLRDEGGAVLETVTTTGVGAVPFITPLDQGFYSITERDQDGWSSDGGSTECTFDVEQPADSGRLFECEFTNTYQPVIDVQKQADALAKVGADPIDDIEFDITVSNESPTPGAAGAPSLTCTLDDEPVDELDQTLSALAPGDSASVSDTYPVPEGWNTEELFENTVAVTCVYPDDSSAAVALTEGSVNVTTTEVFAPSIQVTKSVDVDEALPGDTATFTVEIENTSSSNSPDLELQSFSDDLVNVPGSVLTDADCDELAAGESCSFSYGYVALESDNTVNNNASAEYGVITPEGANLDGSAFPNVLTDSDDASFTVVHPSFTVTKTCVSDLVAPGGPAEFHVVFTNTGDVDVEITADDGIEPFTLLAGGTATKTVTVTAPELGGAATVDNTVTATASYGELWTSDPQQASDSCDIGSYTEVVKTTTGVDTSAADYVWPFALYEDSSHSVDVGTEIGSGSTDGSGAGTIAFAALLDPAQMYTICEEVDSPSAAWTPDWQTVTVNGTVIPIDPADVWNPDYYQSEPQSLGRSCLDIGAGTDYPLVPNRTTSVAVDNHYQYQGGQRTIGYWKNWSTCSGGNQVETAAKLGGTEASRWLLDDTLPMTLWETIDPAAGFTLSDCASAVSLLGKSPTDSRKPAANDALYSLTAQLIAAKANVTAGAGICTSVADAIDAAEALLAEYEFDGTGSYLAPKDAKSSDEAADDRELGFELAGLLDEYNNGNIC